VRALFAFATTVTFLVTIGRIDLGSTGISNALALEPLPNFKQWLQNYTKEK